MSDPAAQPQIRLHPTEATSSSSDWLCAGDKDNLYKGVLDCFGKTFRNEGMLAFYNGFIPNFARLGSWNVVMFLTVEQVWHLLQRIATSGSAQVQVVLPDSANQIRSGSDWTSTCATNAPSSHFVNGMPELCSKVR